jgi:hypothetical protein
VQALAAFGLRHGIDAASILSSITSRGRRAMLTAEQTLACKHFKLQAARSRIGRDVRLERNGKRTFREKGYGKSNESGTETLGQISAVRGVARQTRRGTNGP